jgi:N-methylhydantoinase B/oxoprolinase/acetone carboxylase alpha subunit
MEVLNSTSRAPELTTLETGMHPRVFVCLSAIIYYPRCLINYDIPLNQGCLASINVVNPYGSILNPSENAAVYAGNTQTSQRLVDGILKAFEVRPKNYVSLDMY